MERKHLYSTGLLAVGLTAFIAATPSAQEAAPASPAAAQVLALTIDEAVRRAVEHNPDLARVRLGTDVGIARISETRSAFAPVFEMMAGRTGAAAPPSSVLAGDDGIDTDEWFSTAGVRQRLRAGGGTWSVAWDVARTSTNSPLTTFDPSLQSGLQLAFSQPLLRNREIDQARRQTTLAERDLQSAEYRFQESLVQTVAAVKQAYWTLKAALANVAVQQRSLALAQDLVRENRVRVEVGQVPPLDLVQAEAEVAQRREGAIRAETVARDAEDRLRRLIMDPSDASFWQTRLDPVDDPQGAAPPDADAAVARALGDRHDLARARQDLADADTDVRYLDNQRLPDVRLEASYRGGGAGGTELVRTGPFPGVITGRLETGFNDVLGQLFTHDYASWSVGLTMSYPLGRSFEEAGLARAEIERRQAALDIASLQLRIAEAVRQAARQVESTAERVAAAEAGRELAEERLEVEQRRFDAGLSTTFLVTQAQRDLLQAEVSLLQATLDHQSSVVSFEAVQLAPAEPVDAVAARPVVALPAPRPQGVFRGGGGA